MATPDFSKIWGSNGDVTYKFTDDNYLTGWKFIGDVPPFRGMFDAYFKGTDEKFKFLNDSFNEEKTKSLTIDDATKPTSNTAQLLATLSGLATMIKGAKGTSTWRDTPPTTLAQVATLIGNLSSGSDVTWSGKKFTNSKLGISGLMETNGYVSFGPNFGGLIIQWGRELLSSNGQQFAMPIAMPNCWAIIINDVDLGCDRFGASKNGNTSFLVWAKGDSNAFAKTEFMYVLFGAKS